MQQQFAIEDGINVTLVEDKFNEVRVYVNGGFFGSWDKSFFGKDFADMKKCKTIKDFLFNILSLDRTYYSTNIHELVDGLYDFFDEDELAEIHTLPETEIVKKIKEGSWYDCVKIGKYYVVSAI